MAILAISRRFLSMHCGYMCSGDNNADDNGSGVVYSLSTQLSSGFTSAGEIPLFNPVLRSVGQLPMD